LLCLKLRLGDDCSANNPQDWMSDDTENSLEGASRETSPKRRGGYQCQDRNSGAVTDKEAAHHKSTDG